MADCEGVFRDSSGGWLKGYARKIGVLCSLYWNMGNVTWCGVIYKFSGREWL